MAMFPSDYMSKSHEDYTASMLAWEPLGVGSTNPVGGTALGSGLSGNIPLMPLAIGVGQMKLDAPPRYAGQRQPGVRVWLTQMQRYMRLMRYPPSDWLDVVAMRVEGAASTWVNAVLEEIAMGHRPVSGHGESSNKS